MVHQPQGGRMRGQRRHTFTCHSASASASTAISLSLPLDPAQTPQKFETACRCLFLHMQRPKSSFHPPMHGPAFMADGTQISVAWLDFLSLTTLRAH